MAQVRRATDTVLGRDVAVKLFREDLDDESAARVKTEMQTLASLTHPGLVAVHDAGTELDEHGVAQPFLVMELVDGPTLAACCLDGSLTSEQLVQVGAELASALQYVHDRGVVHRDVKPANILLSPSGVKLADFGIARIVDGVRHTSTGLTVGTAPYLSPEQVTGDAVGPAADVYALGLVLLECLTGQREYTGGPVETALARLHRQPDVPASLPAPWPTLLRTMTARSPADRPTAAAVAVVLREERTSGDTQVLVQQTKVLPTRVRGLLPLTGALAALVLLAVAITVLFPAHLPKAPAPTRPATTTPLQQHLADLDKAVHP
jgi:serine/threonine protein kinase